MMMLRMDDGWWILDDDNADDDDDDNDDDDEEEEEEEEKGEGQEDEEECEHLDINNRQLILRRTRQADTCKPLLPKPAPVLSNLLSLHGRFPGVFGLGFLNIHPLGQTLETFQLSTYITSKQRS